MACFYFSEGGKVSVPKNLRTENFRSIMALTSGILTTTRFFSSVLVPKNIKLLLLLIIVLLGKPCPGQLNALDEGIVITAVGDIMLSRGLSPLLEKNGPDYPFAGTKHIFRNSDIAIGNLECYISSRTLDAGNFFNFRASTPAVSGLKNAGFNVLTLANNHVFDGGYPGVRDTVSILQEHKIAYCGAGSDIETAQRPASLQIKGKKIAVISCTTLMPAGLLASKNSPGLVSPGMLVSQIRRLRVYYDYVIVSCHWGEELAEKPRADDIKTAHALIDAGAELVIGHHPHTIQGIEIYKGKAIIYSLGNFIFDNPSEPTRKAFIAEYTILPRSKTLRVIPIERKLGVAYIPGDNSAIEIVNRIKTESSDFNTEISVSTDSFSVIISSISAYIEVDKAAKKLTFIKEGRPEYICDVAVGMDDCTPPGRFTIMNKTSGPSYINDNREIVAPGSAENPLGKRWMGLDRWNLRTNRQYGIHGTNDETRIGREISRGCVELFDRDIQNLFSMVPVGTEVHILNNRSAKDEPGENTENTRSSEN